FVDAVCDEVVTEQPVVLVQDYHFALAPRLIRKRLPSSTIVAFWHIPWPSPRDFAVCPWRRELLEGLLGCTIVGFQTRDDCQNFTASAELFLGAGVDRVRNVVALDGVPTMVRSYPVSVEYPSRWVGECGPVSDCRAAVRREIGLPPDVAVGVGID